MMFRFQHHAHTPLWSHRCPFLNWLRRAKASSHSETATDRRSTVRSQEENRIYQREWRKRNRERVNDYKAQWARELRRQHPGLAADKARAYRARNPGKAGAACRRWYRKNVEKSKARARGWQRANPEKVRAWSRRWHLNNPGKNAKRSHESRKKHPKNSTKYFADRRRIDATFRLITNLRTRINRALSRKCKLDSTIALLGCSARFFKKYISGLFLPGMSWEARNFEIDHIQPISSFDLTTLDGQRAAFNYRNTQPLFRADNLRKGGNRRLPG